jgi:hypothetical protein
MLDREYIYQAMRNQRLLYLTSRGRPFNFPPSSKGGIRPNSGGSDPFDPLDLSPQPTLWVDAINGAYTGGTTDNNGTRKRGNLVDSATAMTGQSVVNTGTQASKGIWNGEGFWMKSTAQFTVGAIGDYDFLHNGSNFDVWCAFTQTVAASGNQRALISTNGFSSTAIGFLLYYNNAAGANNLELRIGNGTAAVISRTVAGAITQNALNVIRVTKTGNVVTVFVNGVQVTTQTASLSFSASNSVTALTLSSVTAATATHYMKDVVIFNRALTAGEVTQMNARTFTTITPTACNVYVQLGDSNNDGQQVSSGAGAELQGKHNILSINQANATVGTGDFIELLEMGRNHKLKNGVMTLNGGEMRIGYNFTDPNIKAMILKLGVGSTDATAWTSPNNPYGQWINMINKYIPELYHAHRRTATLRGIIYWHGANDTQAGDGSNYESAMIALAKATIDTWLTHTTNFGAASKARHVIFETKNGTGLSFDAAAYALTHQAQINMGNGSFITANPSYTDRYLGHISHNTDSEGTTDGTHYSNYNTMGNTAVADLSPYQNE